MKQERIEKDLIEGATKSWELSMDLVEALKSSKVYETGKESRYFALDVLVGIGQFTSIVIGALEKASKEENCNLREFYVNDVLNIMNTPIDELIARHIIKEEDLTAS